MKATDDYLKEQASRNRIKRSVDRMSEEKGTLRKATVDLITTKECKKKLKAAKGVVEVHPAHLCTLTPGFFRSSRTS